ncbi:hypothetical protein SAMN05216359_10214 [Roseateles sp. YR242]|nr:hypothetical protein SAMN05216359_10214 [Roseateles sp. YR242]
MFCICSMTTQLLGMCLFRKGETPYLLRVQMNYLEFNGWLLTPARTFPPDQSLS